MRDLTAFLRPNVEAVENIFFAASKRMKQEDGTAVKWELRCVSATEDEEIRRSATKRNNSRGQTAGSETDITLYLARLAARCTVYPDLDNKELQDSYGVMGAEALLRAMLTPGEYTEFLREVQKICGFDLPFEQLVDEAKN